MPRPKPVKVGNPEPITLTAIVGLIVNGITLWLVSYFKTMFTWVYSAGRQVVVGGMAMMGMTVLHAMVEFAPDQAIKMMKGVTEKFYAPPAEWATFIAEYLNSLTGGQIQYEDLVREGGIIGSKAATEALGERFLHPLLNLIMPGSEGPGRIARLTPQDGVDGAERFLGVNLQFQMSAWLLHLYGDLMSFGMWKSLKDLPNAISWSYGIGWLSWLVMGVPFQMTISDPLREHYNLIYRPTRMSEAQLIKAWRMGEIGDAEIVSALRSKGWEEELIPILMKLGEKQLSKAEAKLLFDHHYLTFDQLKVEYQERGYQPGEALALATIDAFETERKIIAQIADEAFDQYVDGKLDEGTFRQYQLEAGYTDEQIALLRVLAQMKRVEPPPKAPAERGLSPANVGNLYKKNRIPLEEANSLWLEAGVRSDQLKYWHMLYESTD